MKNAVKILGIILMASILTTANAQENEPSAIRRDKTHRNIKATASVPINRDMSEEQACRVAVAKAKENIISDLKIMEDVRGSVNILIDSDKSSTLLSTYLLELQADIDVKDVACTVKEVGKERFMTVTINADVTVFSNMNYLEVTIDGLTIGNVYREGEHFTFSITLNDDAYIRCFAFDPVYETGAGSLLYPLANLKDDDSGDYVNINNDKHYKAGIKYDFPDKNERYGNNQPLTFPLSLTNSNNAEEFVIFCVVATKKNKPLPPTQITYNSFFKWYSKLAPEERSSINFIPIRVVK